MLRQPASGQRSVHPGGARRIDSLTFGRVRRIPYRLTTRRDHRINLFRSNPMSCVRSAAALVGLCLVVGSATAAGAPAIAIEVDARELPRKLLHTTLDIPCKSGPLRLWYPKWFPGSHGPHGRVEDVAGLRIETPEGGAVPWARDEVQLHCFVINVPEGTRSVRVKLDTVCESTGPAAAGIHTAGT